MENRLKKAPILLASLLLTLFLCSCESEEERFSRLINQKKNEFAEEKEKARIVAEREQIRLQREEEQKNYEKYINNSLPNGATPYSNCFGRNASCNDWGCSSLEVITPFGSDVLVTIKKSNSVVKHAYVRAGSSYTFEMPNGTYQPFFYYGKGWDPNKPMPSSSCKSLKGGFLARESFDKDLPQRLENQTLTYTLQTVTNGNFQTIDSDPKEAF